jgi:protein-tyrosine-phosphatase
MAHILVICTANICRSPVVEAVLRDRLHKQGHHDWQVSSAGTWATQRRGASAYSIDVLYEREGLDINGHLSRGVTAALLAEADLVLCMEAGHAEALRAEFPTHASKVFMLSQMVNNRRFNVSDPYGGPRDGYEQMVTHVTDLVEKGLPRIIELAQSGPTP